MNTTSGTPKRNTFNLLIILLLGCGVALLFKFVPSAKDSSSSSMVGTGEAINPDASSERPVLKPASRSRDEQPPEEQVAARLVAFSKNRREVAHRYAEKLGITVPPELDQFFDAADAGDRDEVERLFKQLEKEKNNPKNPNVRDLQKLFPTIHEVWGAHASAREWGAQALLDYGRDVLGSLKPGTVYFGGTDPGRFIPTLLNATSSGDQHIVLTQNALADGTYLKYVEFLYGDRLKSLSSEDSQSAFNQFLQGASKRLEEGKLRPGENVKKTEGRIQVSGQAAVMAINELLVQTLREKNPGMSFAMEESFSLPSTYSNAVPRGPILELGSGDSSTKLTPSIAAASLDYWRERIGQITSEPEFVSSEITGKAYAHMIVAQGNLFLSQNFSSEAEQAYRLAQQLASRYDLEPTVKLHHLLVQSGRTAEAETVVQQFQGLYPDKAAELRTMLEPR